MNAKVLITPLIIVICIGLMIWLVYPAYTNGIDGIKEKSQQLTEEKNKLADAKEKSGNVSKLTAQMNSEKESSALVLSFVPDGLKEEEIIDNLNFIVTNEGLLVTNINVEPAKSENTTVAPVTETGMPVDASVIQEAVKAKDYAVDLEVIGDYDQIKNMLEKIYKLKRFNMVKIAEIKKMDTQTSDKKTVSSGTLKTIITLNFNMLKKQDKINAISNPAFARTSFDMSVAGMIREKKSVDVLKMNIDQAGRSNPFMP